MSSIPPVSSTAYPNLERSCNPIPMRNWSSSPPVHPSSKVLSKLSPVRTCPLPEPDYPSPGHTFPAFLVLSLTGIPASLLSSGQQDGGGGGGPTLKPLHECILPEGEDFNKIHLVRGGRWLLTSNQKGVLKLWDTEPPPTLSSAPGPSSSSSVTVKPLQRVTPTVYAEGRFANDDWMIDAYTSADGAHLYVFMQLTPQRPSYAVLSVPLPRHNSSSTSSSSPQVSVRTFEQFRLWRRRMWADPNGGQACFDGDLGVFTKRTLGEPTYVWNWRTNLWKKFRYEAPPNAENLVSICGLVDYQ